jgi:arylsulfatase A-like enzyme
VDTALHYQIDVGATLLGLAGGTPHDAWDGRAFHDVLRQGGQAGREALVLSQAAWTCQRSVRFRDNGRDYLWIATRHDGYHGYPDEMLFDLGTDPHEEHDIHKKRPDLCAQARTLLIEWRDGALAESAHGDPMDEVMAEGGPKHVRDALPGYLDRLRSTGRGTFADAFAARAPG